MRIPVTSAIAGLVLFGAPVAAADPTVALPEAAERACITIAASGTVEVPLQNPLGDRHLLSG